MIKKLLEALLFTTTFTFFPIIADHPQPYTNVKILPYIPYYLEDAYSLVTAVKNVSPTVFVDAGSVDGVAARFIAQYDTSGITIFAVNLFKSYDPSQNNLFQKFLSNVVQENTTGQIIPIRMSSIEAANALSLTADVVFVESNSPTLQNEILAWSSHLSPVGVICGLGWLDSTVQVIVTKAAATLGCVVTSSDDFWTIERE